MGTLKTSFAARVLKLRLPSKRDGNQPSALYGLRYCGQPGIRESVQGNFSHSMLLNILSLLLGCWLLINAQTSWAQRSPADLADIPLNELLTIQVEGTEADQISGQASEIEDLTSGSRFAFWYRYKQIRFHGYRDGTKDLSNAQVLKQFPVLPTIIDQDAHVFGLNYRHSNRLSYLVSIPYIHQSTEHIRRVGAPFTLESEDFGDLSLAGNFTVFRYGKTAVVLSLGITVPTGTIDAKGDTPRGKATQLPYAMQIGSGTWDLHPGIAYATSKGQWNIGSTLESVIRLGNNDRDYSLGDQASLTLWANRNYSARTRFSAHLRADAWGDISGADVEVNPLIAPVADPKLYGGKQVQVGGSVRYKWKEAVYDDYFLKLSAALPVWQDLTGPQPKQEWVVSVGFGIGFE